MPATSVRIVQLSNRTVIVPSFVIVGRRYVDIPLYADRLAERIQSEFGIAPHRFLSSGSKAETARELASKILAESAIPFIVEGLRRQIEVDEIRAVFPDIVVVRLLVDEKQRLDQHREPTLAESEHRGEPEVEQIVPDVTYYYDYKMGTVHTQTREIVNAINAGKLGKLLR